MFKRNFLFQCVCCLLAYSNIAYTAPITWVAQSPNNDLNDPSNWDPNTVPGSLDSAIFNSNISGIATNPIDNSAPFSVLDFNFISNASIFNFNFNNTTLTFNGIGIKGLNTDPTITINNVNNNTFASLLTFFGGLCKSGSSIITSSNSATLSGSLSSTGIGIITSNLFSGGPFTISEAGKITAINIGNDSTSGTGSNATAYATSQLEFDESFTAENDVVISVSNSGTFSGNNTVTPDAVSIIFGSQFISYGAFQVGDNFNCDVQNTGNDSGLGVGLCTTGRVDNAQMNLLDTGIVGDNCTINISNTGINASSATNFPNFVGNLNDQQFFAGGNFQANDNFTLIVSNTGSDTGNGYGSNQVAIINSNSGTTGNQILFLQGCALGEHATISATNSGTYSGSNTSTGSNIAGMNLQQIVVGDSIAPGTNNLIAGDYFSLSASSTGVDSSNGRGGNSVGNVSTDQITLYSQVTLGSNANITLSQSGNFSGNASNSYVNVGSSGGSQLNCVSSFSAEDNFTLSASNSGTMTGTGIGGYFIGDVITGQQVAFQDSFIIGNNASISISNSGSISSNTTFNNQVGSLLGYGKQLLAKDTFQVGDDFLLTITNTGFDGSTGDGGNFAGFINNNTADNSASQFHLADGGTIGDRASITISNTGTYQGSNTTTGNVVGVLAGQQMRSVDDFYAGNNFSLTVSNTGNDNASGQNNNNIGTTGNSQVEFQGACNIGDDAAIVISNIGTNNDITGILNNIALINGSQMSVNGNFTAGRNFNLTAANHAINAGNSNNSIGFLSSSQLNFAQSCTFNDGSFIAAFNSGTVSNSQIVFNQGFNVASGKVTIETVNEGTVGSFGIDIQGNSLGGNAIILLGNSSLNIGTTLPTFTIGGLSGDSTSTAQSLPQLIINTDASTESEFLGVIQNYPVTNSTLMKAGAGTQKLSGANTYTGLTTVEEGFLVLNGSLAGDVLVNPFGTLKGNGSIAGTLTNMGVVSPGESIGILTVGNYINNNGTYDVEVNGLGQSDLIDVLGTATLNGGTVVVSSTDGLFRLQQPYTIVTAEQGVVGTYTGATSAAFINPTLTYDPNNVYLTIQSALLNAAEKCNQIGVATNLDGIIGPNDAQNLLISTIANLPLESAQEALESLSGFQYTNDVLMTNISLNRFLRRLYDPLRPLVTETDGCCPCNEWTSWFEIGYDFTNLHGRQAHKLNFDSYQLTGGIQKTFCCDLTVGLAGSYEHDNVHYHDGKANRNSAYASVYGLYKPNAFYGLFDLVYGHSSNRLKRTIDVENLQYTARSKPNFNLYTFYGEAGYDLDCGCLLIQPFLGIQIGKNWRGCINENQADGWGLIINKHDWSTTSSRLGLHLSTNNVCECVDISLDVAWNQLWSSRNNSAVGHFKEFGNPFSICGSRLDTSSIDYALTFTTYICEGLKGYFEVDGESWQHANTFNVLGGIQFSW